MTRNPSFAISHSRMVRSLAEPQKTGGNVIINNQHTVTFPDWATGPLIVFLQPLTIVLVTFYDGPYDRS